MAHRTEIPKCFTEIPRPQRTLREGRWKPRPERVQPAQVQLFPSTPPLMPKMDASWTHLIAVAVSPLPQLETPPHALAHWPRGWKFSSARTRHSCSRCPRQAYLHRSGANQRRGKGSCGRWPRLPATSRPASRGCISTPAAGRLPYKASDSVRKASRWAQPNRIATTASRLPAPAPSPHRRGA